jgi:hypothetical protein
VCREQDDVLDTRETWKVVLDRLAHLIRSRVESCPMSQVPFNAANPDMAIVRQVVFQRLRAEPEWRILDLEGRGFLKYVELTPPRQDDLDEFSLLALDVFWQLIIEGVLSPGLTPSDPNLPHFHRTAYGKKVIAATDYEPHDQTGYLARLRSRIAQPDDTVFAYLEECLQTFVRGNLVASMVMLGVAAERVFDLVCDALLPALADPTEHAALSKVLDRYAMKPKVDWVHDKIRRIQHQTPRPTGFPENAALMVTAIYDMIRSQRNDLGHPRDLPPRLGRGDAHANIQIFPRYYETAEVLREVLGRNRV